MPVKTFLFFKSSCTFTCVSTYVALSTYAELDASLIIHYLLNVYPAILG